MQRRIVQASLDLRFGSSALQVVVQVRKAHDLLDVGVVDAIEPLRALPLTFPVLRVGHGVGNLELFSARQQAEPFDDAQWFARSNVRTTLIHPVVITAEVPSPPY